MLLHTHRLVAGSLEGSQLVLVLAWELLMSLALESRCDWPEAACWPHRSSIAISRPPDGLTNSRGGVPVVVHSDNFECAMGPNSGNSSLKAKI